MADKTCPLLREPCVEHKCRWYIQLMGKHPQSGVPVAEFGCAIEWLPVLMIEQSKEVRQTAAAVESFRNVNAAAAAAITATMEKVADSARQVRTLEHKG